ADQLAILAQPRLPINGRPSPATSRRGIPLGRPVLVDWAVPEVAAGRSRDLDGRSLRRGGGGVGDVPCWRGLVALLTSLAAGTGRAEDFAAHAFEPRQLTDSYYSEGIAAGDLDRDGRVDIVYGPYWFAGPDFKEKREIYPPKPQDKEGYADHFF